MVEPFIEHLCILHTHVQTPKVTQLLGRAFGNPTACSTVINPGDTRGLPTSPPGIENLGHSFWNGLGLQGAWLSLSPAPSCPSSSLPITKCSALHLRASRGLFSAPPRSRCTVGPQRSLAGSADEASPQWPQLPPMSPLVSFPFALPRCSYGRRHQGRPSWLHFPLSLMGGVRLGFTWVPATLFIPSVQACVCVHAPTGTHTGLCSVSCTSEPGGV